jgi:molybdopterin biosynthesis enzyme MoaB
MEQPVELVGRALVVVVDDRTAHGEEDHNGPLVTELLIEAASWWTASWWCPPTRSRSATR